MGQIYQKMESGAHGSEQATPQKPTTMEECRSVLSENLHLKIVALLAEKHAMTAAEIAASLHETENSLSGILDTFIKDGALLVQGDGSDTLYSLHSKADGLAQSIRSILFFVRGNPIIFKKESGDSLEDGSRC